MLHNETSTDASTQATCAGNMVTSAGRSSPAILNFRLASLLSLTILIPGAGYLVDMYDLFLFNMVRVRSLTELGLTGEQVTQTGIQIINSQLFGLIVGAYIWGVLGDRCGRKKVLVNSILLYSIASILTAFVEVPWMYALLRFFTGIGLAGELGAGVTLISEKFTDRGRGLGVGAFIILGFVGVLLASGLAQILAWRTCYLIGGILGFVLLLFRLKLRESELFEKARARGGVIYGGFKPILNRTLLLKYIVGIIILLPSVFIPQILWSLSPELALVKGLKGIDPAKILGLGYSCVILGDLMAIFLAERIRQRKKVIALFAVVGCLVFTLFMCFPIPNAESFYFLSSLLGFAFGIWVVGATMIAEMFGTNVRATATTTIPNFCRGCVILMNGVLISLKPLVGIHAAIFLIGSVVFTMALVALCFVKDTYGREMDYTE